MRGEFDMVDFDGEITEVETTFVNLPDDRLIELMALIEIEAKECESENPKRAHKLHRACKVGATILQYRANRKRYLEMQSSPGCRRGRVD